MTEREEVSLMRAVVHDRYGPPTVLHLETVERPAVKEDEVLIRIHATTVNRTDCGLRSAEFFMTRFFTGLLRPKKKVLGMELAGVVEAVGRAVDEFDVGDQVFGVNAAGFGANAEFVCVRQSAPLARKPVGMSFEGAAAVCDGAILALTCLRSANLQKGQRILVYGASGSIGTAGLQLASYFGAEVTAVCRAKNAELVRSLGAGTVIDYTKEDFTKNGEQYDVILDAAGKLSFLRCRRSLTPGGVFVATDGLRNLALSFLAGRFGGRKVRLLIPRYTKKDVLFLKGLIEAGRYCAVIDRRYPLEGIVEAAGYVETEHKTGSVVLIVRADGGS